MDIYQQEGNIENVSCIPNNEEKYISFIKSIKVSEFNCKKTQQFQDIMFEIRFLD
jgi:hypothetical protein